MSNEEKLVYIQTAQIGTLVAFVVSQQKGIYLSGKIIDRDNEKCIITVQTRKGTEYIVKFEDVLWVRTGKRWPRAIFELLFGGKENHERKSESAN